MFSSKQFLLPINLFQIVKIILFTLQVFQSGIALDRYPTKDIDGVFNYTYREYVNRSMELAFRFDIADVKTNGEVLIKRWYRNTDLKDVKITLHVWRDRKDSSYDFPLYAYAALLHEVVPIQIPSKSFTESILNWYGHASRALCIPREGFIDYDEQQIVVRVSTGSPTDVNFRLKMDFQQNTILRNNEAVNGYLSPATPLFLYYEFDDNSPSDSALIKVTSEDDYCMILAIQQDDCPVRDVESSVRFQSKWLTLTTQGAITIKRDKTTDVGFYVKLVVTEDDKPCGSFVDRPIKPSQSRLKKINLIAKPGIDILSVDQLWWSVLSPLVLTILVGVGTGSFYIYMYRESCIADKIELDVAMERRQEAFDRGGNDAVAAVGDYEGLPCGASLKRDLHDQDADCESAVHLATGFSLYSFCLNIRNRGMRVLDFIYNPVSEEALNATEVIFKYQSSDYLKWMRIISGFYAIPVIQLATFGRLVLNKTGEYDVCYYNSLCSHPVWIFQDFNHVWSNVSYLVFGLAFIAIVQAKKDLECFYYTPRRRRDFGIRFHPGLFFAMGYNLVMVALMSAVYHICPNELNFQYDTCFMYVLTLTLTLKMIEFRHPQHISINKAFGILFTLSLMSAAGLFLETFKLTTILWIYRIGTVVAQAYFVMYFAVYKLLLGSKVDAATTVVYGTDIPMIKGTWIIPRAWNLNKDYPRPDHRKERCGIVIVFVLLNLCLIAHSFYMDYAHYILEFLVSHYVVYFFYYMGCKIVRGEFAWNFKSIQTVLYLLLCLAFLIPAMYFFTQNITEWSQPPAQSRMANEECGWISGFYDQHDVWHFLSAFAIFFMLMTLLSIDDGVNLLPRKKLKQW